MSVDLGLRAAILEAAMGHITKDRAATHGRAENSFNDIAAHWSWWLAEKLKGPISAYDVAQMMVGFKQARAKGNPGHRDNHEDLCGYAAIGGELALNAAAQVNDTELKVPESLGEHFKKERKATWEFFVENLPMGHFGFIPDKQPPSHMHGADLAGYQMTKAARDAYDRGEMVSYLLADGTPVFMIKGGSFVHNMLNPGLDDFTGAVNENPDIPKDEVDNIQITLVGGIGKPPSTGSAGVNADMDSKFQRILGGINDLIVLLSKKVGD